MAQIIQSSQDGLGFVLEYMRHDDHFFKGIEEFH